MALNPIWLENIIKEMAQDIKDLKEIMKTVNSPPPKKETKYPINKHIEGK
jgi:hypothetical protein